MMRLLKIAVLFACHGEAMKVKTGSPLKSMVGMIEGMLTKAIEDLGAHNKECAGQETGNKMQVDTLRMQLTRLIGGEKVPNTATDAADAEMRCVSGDDFIECAGEWKAFEEERNTCDLEEQHQSSKATTAYTAMLQHKYARDDTTQACKDYSSSAPTALDESECATEWRIDFKQDQLASVARQCKKTMEIMDIALNIYKSKGLGASFIQLAQEENVRAEAKTFLETHASTAKNAELTKLLHDFSQQVKRDCHQDMSDIKADINALSLHRKSKQNSAASEKRAHATAKDRQHQAAQCRIAAKNNRDSVFKQAIFLYAQFYKLCPAESSTDSTQCAASDPGTSDADFNCAWKNDSDRVDQTTCAGSVMAHLGYCDTLRKELSSYKGQLETGLKTLKTVINAESFIQLSPAFIQLNAEDSPKENTALVQESGSFEDLVTAIGQAMENEISKLNADSSDVNAFAQLCENALQQLDTDDPLACLIDGSPCTEATDSGGRNCDVCVMESQCHSINSNAIVAANNERAMSNSEMAEQAEYEKAKEGYATASRIRDEARKAFAQADAKVATDEATMNQAIADVSSGCEEEWVDGYTGTTTGSCNNIKTLVDVLQEAKTDMLAKHATYETEETAVETAWTDGTHSDGQGARAYWETITSVVCEGSATAGLSHKCKLEDYKSQKVGYAQEKATYENRYFQDCERTNSALVNVKKAQAAMSHECKVGVTKDLKEELHKMTEALQILQQAKTKIAGTA